MNHKQRVEPEVSMPEDSAEAGTPTETPEVSVEDLVPGLDEEIARQQNDEAEVDAAAAMLAELEAERDQFRDKWQRALAEGENVRRRAERDRKDAETYGGTRLARDLLSVYDNLERALKAADEALRENHGPFLEGVELTQRELLNAFAKHKIEKVTPEVGEKFDPNLHQAISMVPPDAVNPPLPANHVATVLQKGYLINDRVLRPALVTVVQG